MPLDSPSERPPPSPTVPLHLPRMRYPTSLTPGRPHPSHHALTSDGRETPLHRRGTSSKYESLEELLREHGYKDVRVITPLTERLASQSRKFSGVAPPPLPPPEAPPLRAVDLLRSLASAYSHAPSSNTTLSTPSLPSVPSPSPSPSPSPRFPTPPTTHAPLSFLTTDPYSHTPSKPSKLPHHTRSTPSLPRRPLTPLTNTPPPHYRLPAPPARPIMTPTRVQCHSHTHAALPRRSTPLPVLAPSPALSPSAPRAETDPLPRPSQMGPQRARSIRSLRAHLSRPTTPTPTKSKSRSRERKPQPQPPRPESPEPDFSDLGMLRDGGWMMRDGEEDEQEEVAAVGNGREGWGWEYPKRGKRMGLPWSWL